MEHANKYGESKVKRACALPLTGQQVVHRLITDLAIFDFTPNGIPKPKDKNRCKGYGWNHL